MRSPDDGLRALFRKHLPQVHWCTIETGGTQLGVPDLEGCYGGVSFWVECKATQAWALRKSKSTVFQAGWHARRADLGGSSFVAVRRRPPKGGDELYLYAGRDYSRLIQEGLRGSAQPLLTSLWGPSCWDWELILKRLRSR